MLYTRISKLIFKTFNISKQNNVKLNLYQLYYYYLFILLIFEFQWYNCIKKKKFKDIKKMSNKIEKRDRKFEGKY